MSLVGSVILAWAVIVVLSLIAGLLARRMGQPAVIGEMALGLVLGPSVIGALWPAFTDALFPGPVQHVIAILARIGVMLLMFEVGLRFDFAHVRTASRTVAAVAAAGLVLPFAGGLALAPWLHVRFAPDVPVAGFTLFTCIALAITALPVMARILLELGITASRPGVVAISAAALDDLAGWLLLAVATALVTAGPLAPTPSMAQASPLVDALRHFAYFAALVAGVALRAAPPFVAAWRRVVAPVVAVALVPLFFVSTGLRTRVGSLEGGPAWIALAAVMAVAILGKLGGAWMAARATGIPPAEARCIGALMNTRGLMGLVAISIGADLGMLPPPMFTILVVMALVTTAMTGPLLRRWLPPGMAAGASGARIAEGEAA